jgi:hypothetical protein
MTKRPALPFRRNIRHPRDPIAYRAFSVPSGTSTCAERRSLILDGPRGQGDGAGLGSANPGRTPASVVALLGRSRRGSRHLEMTTTSAYLASCNSTARESAAADAAVCPHVWPPPHHDHDQDAHNAPRGVLSARSPSPGATFATRRSGVRVPLAHQIRNYILLSQRMHKQFAVNYASFVISCLFVARNAGSSSAWSPAGWHRGATVSRLTRPVVAR